MLLICSATGADDLVRVTANNAGRRPRIKGEVLRHFLMGRRYILGRSRAFPGPRDRPNFPLAAALAAAAWGMSIGALIKGDAVLPSEVSLKMRPA